MHHKCARAESFVIHGIIDVNVLNSEIKTFFFYYVEIDLNK
jgi:hypothetical protein